MCTAAYHQGPLKMVWLLYKVVHLYIQSVVDNVLNGLLDDVDNQS